MRLVASSGDAALDRPAWGSITNSNPFPALPRKFTGQYLALRIRYYYNPYKSDIGANAHQYGLGLGTIGRTVEGVEILSNAPGVEFGSYLQIVVGKINQNWRDQIPASEARKGKLTIEVAILKDGKVADMWLDTRPGGRHGDALVRMAWASITKSNPFPPLPSEFTGSFLALRFHFDYSHR